MVKGIDSSSTTFWVYRQEAKLMVAWLEVDDLGDPLVHSKLTKTLAAVASRIFIMFTSLMGWSCQLGVAHSVKVSCEGLVLILGSTQLFCGAWVWGKEVACFIDIVINSRILMCDSSICKCLHILIKWCYTYYSTLIDLNESTCGN